MAMKIISVTDIGDFKLGNAEDREKGTGCTVIICEEGAVGGVDVRGGGPATRETDLLRSENTVNAVNAVVLSGGSAFGLEAASGVMRELADRRIGFDVGDNIVVPIVCGASLYDLPVGDPKAFPDVDMGIQAVRNAYEGSFANGNHGAGTGATVGKLKGYDRAMKTGIGAFACGDGVVEVGAIAAVNAVGDIYNGAGNIIAGLRSEDGKTIYGTIKTLKGMVHDGIKPADESATFNKLDLKEALAAAAKQFEETAAKEAAEEIITESPEVIIEEPVEDIIEEPVEEVIEAPENEVISEAPQTEFTFVIPQNEPEECGIADEKLAEEIHYEDEEEPAEEIITESPEVIIEEPVEDMIEEPVEEAYIEAGDEIISEESQEEPQEEPVVFAEEPAEGVVPETAEEPVEEVINESTEEFTEEPEPEAVEEPDEEFIPETPAANAFTEHYGQYDEISIPVISPETLPEASITEESEVFEEPQPEAPETEPEVFEEPVPETPETEPEAFEESVPEALEAEPEQIEYPEEEPFAEEAAEEVAEETIEEEAPAEEEPVVLTREEMGYDIVFNTTISCLITNAALTKSQANKLASILHDAYARAIKPVHGTLDGDTVFVLATGKQQVNFDAFAALATDVMQYAIIDGAMSAEGAYGLPAARDM